MAELDNTKTVECDDDDEGRCEDVKRFAASLSGIDKSRPLETPQFVDEFLDKFESKLRHLEQQQSNSATAAAVSVAVADDGVFLNTTQTLASLINSVSRFKSSSNAAAVLLNLASSLLHRATLILEQQLRLLLETPPHHHDQDQDNKDNIAAAAADQSSSSSINNPPEEEESPHDQFPTNYSSQDISHISSISTALINSGYSLECINLFVVIRRSAMEEEIISHGFEKISIDDVHKLAWETLEGKISTWIDLLKRCTCHLFPGELKFYESVFSIPHISVNLFSNLSTSIIHQIVNPAHALAMTKKSSEKLFKFLELYETLRDLGCWLDEASSMTEESRQDLKSEVTSASSRVGEAAVSIFCEIETSIKTDNTKQAVACGGVHPLTRHIMSYLSHACHHRKSLEELFERHPTTNTDQYDHDAAGAGGLTPFSIQLMIIMKLMDANLDAKSKLYKDRSLRYMFLMNNGRYMLEKSKGSPETYEALGASWCRKRSSDVRNHHKNYQRDTWGKVLQCLSQEGLLVNGKVDKNVLKERLKNFNQLFDEIHRTQSSWAVSDEQLQSELRVSISAVMIPAYRAFLTRFGQSFTPGREYEKHVKYQPEDIENAIEELFEGNANSMPKKENDVNWFL